MIEALPEETGLQYVIRDRDAIYERSSSGGSQEWVWRRFRSLRARLGRIAMRSGSSGSAPRVLESCDCSQRAAGLPDYLELCPLLQSCANPSGPCEKCSLAPELPIASESAGVVAFPEVGGLHHHHRYERVAA